VRPRRLAGLQAVRVLQPLLRAAVLAAAALGRLGRVPAA
jgi:hypothetical protein